MGTKPKTTRLHFIDISRFFALILMIQGHTFYRFLDPSLKTADSSLFNNWTFVRGFTAPYFLIISGLTISYLMIRNPAKLNRIKKGFLRGSILLLAGYLMKLPRMHYIVLDQIPEKSLTLFYQPDILQLIGFCLLLYSFLQLVLIKKAKLVLPVSLLICVITVFSAPFISTLETFNLPLLFRGYINHKSGSLFPLFPWMAFFFFGTSLAHLLKLKAKPWLIFLIIAFLLACSSFLLYHPSTFYQSSASRLFMLISIPLLLISFSHLCSQNINSIPSIIKDFSKNSFWIYIGHLWLLYAVFPMFLNQYSWLNCTFILLFLMVLMYYWSMLISYLRVKYNIQYI